MEVAITPSNVYVGDPDWKKPKCANVITSEEGSLSRNCKNRGTQICVGCYLVMVNLCHLPYRHYKLISLVACSIVGEIVSLQIDPNTRKTAVPACWISTGSRAGSPTVEYLHSSLRHHNPLKLSELHIIFGEICLQLIRSIFQKMRVIVMTRTWLYVSQVWFSHKPITKRYEASDHTASGDLRNILCSILGTPASVPTLCCIINDRDQYVVARNVIFFLVAMCFPATTAAELIIHLWYSARLTEEMLKALDTTIRPLIADMVEKIEGKREDVLLLRRWKFGSRQLIVLLYKEQWSFILQFMDARHLPLHTEARRRDVMLKTDRRDHVDRHLFRLPPKQRICHSRFRETGMLLPFGNCLEGNAYPNPYVM